MRIQQSTAKTVSRLFILSAVSASALWLAGCGSNVRLSDAESSKPAPISTAQMPSANSSGTSSSNVPATQVAPVQAQPDTASAADTSLVRVIYFDYDSNVVKDEFSGAIDAHAKRLTADKAKKLIVEGHTDERGGREYNLALGQRRAEAVQKSLSLLGVSADQVEAVSFGEERPAAQGASEETWAKNRRAELKDR